MLKAANVNAPPVRRVATAASLALILDGFDYPPAQAREPVGLVFTSMRTGLRLIGIHIT